MTADDPHRQRNIQEISALKKFSRITSLNWGNRAESGGCATEILIGRANKFVKIYDVADNDFSSNIEMNDAPIVGLARANGRLVAGIGTGIVQIVADTAGRLEAGDHMSQMRQSPTSVNVIATGGKGRQNNLKIWDLNTQQQTFSTKNVPNDYLQLEVPVWDSDLVFLNDGEHSLATCSRYGYIRRYDTRAQRRPVAEWTNPKEQISYSCLTAAGDGQIFAGTTSGIIRAFDQRKIKVVAHTYKGFTGSISDIGIDESGQYLYSASMDRYVRVHCCKSTALMYQCYVKSKATKILLRQKVADVKSDELNDTDCVFLGEERDDDDEEQQYQGDDDDDQVGGSDPEFDELFDKMPTVRLVFFCFVSGLFGYFIIVLYIGKLKKMINLTMTTVTRWMKRRRKAKKKKKK